MPHLSQYTSGNAPERSQPLLEQVQKSLGFVPNLFATLAESPQVLEGYLTLSAILGRGTLSPAERQVVEIAVSTENSCTYCVAAHSTLAGMLKVGPEIITAVRTGAPLGDSKLDALITFAREAVRRKGFIADSTAAAFLAAGYTKAQLLEVIGHIGLKVIANYVNNLADTPLDTQFQLQQWDEQQLRVA